VTDPPGSQIVISTSPAETEAAGAALAARLSPGDVVLVRGDLGAGKTTFVRGACAALNVSGPVTSPTFTLAARYDGDVPVSHLDLYRLSGLDDEEAALLADEVGPERITFVEWPETALGELEPTHRVTLEHLGGDRRRIEVA
jgi:tRNA threonylcarbamoyladenosine biosynthesis protein TsaE